AGFYAVSAKNAAVVIDVVNLGVPLRAANALLCSVLGRLNIDAICRTVGSAQKTGDAFLQAILVALQNVHATVPLLDLCPPQRPRAIWIVLHRRGLEHLPEGNAHAFGDCGDVLENRHTE